MSKREPDVLRIGLSSASPIGTEVHPELPTGGPPAQRAAELDADRRARVEQLRLHARGLRHLMRYLRPGVRPPAKAIRHFPRR